MTFFAVSGKSNELDDYIRLAKEQIKKNPGLESKVTKGPVP